MARRPSTPSPSAVAIERLGKLAATGSSPARVERDARAILAGWASQHDEEAVQRLTGELQADIAAGLSAATEQLDDVDTSEPGAEKHARAVVAALQAAGRVLAGG